MKASKSLKGIVVRIERGEDLLASLTRLVTEGEIGNGSFQAIGAVSRARLGIFEDGEYEWIAHEGALEISSCLGNVSVKEGRPFVHCHAVMNDHNGTVLGGHVGEGCIADPTIEVHVTVYEDEVTRRYNDESGLWLLDL